MKIEDFCLLTRIIHYLITFGGSIFLIIYKYKSIPNSILRLILIFILWCVSNVIFNGCPLTHIENHLTHFLYGQWPMPNYNFKQSWVYQILNLI